MSPKGSEMPKTIEEQLLSQLKDRHRARRFIGLGARADLLFDVMNRAESLRQWSEELAALGRRFEQAAQEVSEPVVKFENYSLASLYFHLGALGLFADDEWRIELYRSVVRCYRAAMPYGYLPSTLVEYSYGGVQFTGYLRAPAGPELRGAVILLRGQDAAREIELHTISTFLVESGLVTFAIDAAGQGESRFSGMKMPDGLVASVAAAIDQLGKVPTVDTSRIAIVGQSLGGHLALRVAANEPRIRACVAMGTFYSLTDFERGLLARHNAMMNLGVTEEQLPAAMASWTLDGIIEKLDCPLFALNGGEDAVVPPSQTVKIYEKATQAPLRRLRIYEGAPHCVYYDNKNVLLDVAEWLHRVMA